MNILQLVHNHPIISICAAAGGGAAIIEMFAPFIDKLTSFLLGLFFVKKYMGSTYTINIVYDFLNNKAKGYGINQESYEASWEHVRPLGDQYNIWRRNKQNSVRFWLYKGRPVLFLPHYKDDEFGTSSFMFFRWTINWVKLIEEAGKYRDEKVHSTKIDDPKFRIIRHSGSGKTVVTKDTDEPDNAPRATGNVKKEQFHDRDSELLFWNEADIGNPKPDDPMGYLSINDSMAKLIKRVKFWFNNKEWYTDRDIIWKLGVLLHGLPGVGKTAIIRAIAEELDLPLHIFDLATMDNIDFTRGWSSSQADKPRIVAFEDFDTVFHGRKNQIANSTLDYSTILNAIDGLEREHGLLLFITTNRLETIDEALGRPVEEDSENSTRPGRIDVIIKMQDLDKAGRVKMAKRIFIAEPELAEVMAERYASDTAAQFQDRCVQVALKSLWSKITD